MHCVGRLDLAARHVQIYINAIVQIQSLLPGSHPLAAVVKLFALFIPAVSVILPVSATLLILAYAYLQIIKTMYFENSRIAFDRADRGIYAAVLFSVVAMLILMMHPHFLMRDFSGIWEGVLTWR